MDRIERALAKSRRERANQPRASQTLAEKEVAAAMAATRPEIAEAPAKSSSTLPGVPGTAAAQVVLAGSASRGLVALDYTNPIADLFRILRTQLLNALEKMGSTTLGVCSARSGEGKTFIAANIAASIALSQESSALLIDLDLRRPGVHEHFGLSPNPGVTDFLSRKASLVECIRGTSIPGLEVFTAGTPIRNSSEALGSSDLAQAFATLAQSGKRKVTICDLPPLLSSDDALMFSAKLGGVLFVVEEGRTRPGDVQRSLELLTSTRVLGTVLNKSRYNNSFHYTSYSAAAQ